MEGGERLRLAWRAQKGMQPLLSDTFLAPSITDPKLWLVKCKPGKEQSCRARLVEDA